MRSIIFVALLGMAMGVAAQSGKVAAFPVKEGKINLFSLKDVRLEDRNFRHIMELNHDYMLSLDPDRLLSWFRREAGLTPKAQPYPFWESEYMNGHGPLPGHIMGFYLSGISMMYDSTKDPIILERLQYVLKELSLCQEAGGDGYLLPTINGRAIFEGVLRGEFKASNPFIETPYDLCWEPVYVMNKIMLGLYQVYMRCDMPEAKTILIRMADWFGNEVLNKLSHENIQKLLVCEHGSINESFVNVYEITGDKKYLVWAEELNDEQMWVPMSERKDILEGWHANTQIPKFTGFESVFRYNGDERLTEAARFFWETVMKKHTWIMGGNSTGEHFFAPDGFEKRIEQDGGPESCNSVNMLRLTERLYQDYAEPEMIDYYENVLFNHLLANYDPEQGMCVYYTSMKPGHYKVYGTKYDSFWCCTGTGFEQTGKFGQMIYAHAGSELYVNLFIASSVKWKDGISLTQTTDFPDEEATHLTVSGGGKFCLKIRCPYWTGASSLVVSVNGKRKRLRSAGGYVSIDRIWKDGDQIDVEFPMRVEAVPLNGSERYVALKYGPIVLAARIFDERMTKDDFRSARMTVATKSYPVMDVPAFIGDIRRIPSSVTRKGTKAEFVCSGKITSKPFDLVPFYSIHWSRYAVYFRRYAGKEEYLQACEKEKRIKADERMIDEKTVDRVIVSDRKSEEAHRMEAVFSNSGSGWRDAVKGGYFMYQLKICPDVPQSLCLQLLGSDRGARVFDVLIDGKKIGTVDVSALNQARKGGLYRHYIKIPSDCIAGKRQVTVKFQARYGNMAGGIFDVRIVTD